MRAFIVIALMALFVSLRSSGLCEESTDCGTTTEALPPPPVLVVYVSAESAETNRDWMKALDPESEGFKRAKAHIQEIRVIKVFHQSSVRDWEKGGSLACAAEQGVRVLPAIVFLDSKGRVFDLVQGNQAVEILQKGVNLLVEKAQAVRPVSLVNDIPKGENPEEEAVAICRAMDQVPPEVWFRDYPGTMKRLKKLNCTDPAFLEAKVAALRLEKNRRMAALLGASFRAADAQSIRKCLHDWRVEVSDPAVSVEERQLILLSMVHPLWVRLESVTYHDGHTPDSEEAFNQAIAVLEEVRDMNPASVCGQRAHQLREELRKARLAAAKYD